MNHLEGNFHIDNVHCSPECKKQIAQLQKLAVQNKDIAVSSLSKLESMFHTIDVLNEVIKRLYQRQDELQAELNISKTKITKLKKK